MPEMMISSRYIKKIFSGNLNKTINVFNFKIKESELLKCQILRILFDCEISLKGIFDYNQETDKITKNLGNN